MSTKSESKRGIKNPRSKLNDAQVAFIRDSIDSTKALAEKFHISETVVSLIRHNKIWVHVGAVEKES